MAFLHGIGYLFFAVGLLMLCGVALAVLKVLIDCASYIAYNNAARFKHRQREKLYQREARIY